MQVTVLSTVILPLVIFSIMMSLGLTLAVDDFRRLLEQRRLVLIGVVCQFLVLPLLGLGLAFFWQGNPTVALGLVLMAACPGGPVSNLIVYTAHGNRPLSVTLTAISSVACFVTIPLIMFFASQLFADDAFQVRIPFWQTTLQIAFLTLIPLSIGMFWRSRQTAFAERTRTLFRRAGSYALGIVVLALIVQEWQNVITYIGIVGPPALLLCLSALACGSLIARISGVSLANNLTLAVETGMQNAPLAITVALTVLDNPDLALLPAAYGLFETPLIWMIALGFSRLWRLAPPEQQVAY